MRKITVDDLIASGLSKEDAEKAFAYLDALPEEGESTDEGAAAETAAKSGTEEAAAAETTAAEATTEEGAAAETAVTEAATEETAAEVAATEAAPPDLAAENETLRKRVIEAEIRSGALTAGVKPERVGTLARLVDTSGIDLSAKDVNERIAEAIKKVLEELPELAATPGATAGSLGNHARGRESAEAATAEKFRRGMN